MNTTMLSTLAAVVDRGSFAAAAHDVGCTPSAVSLQMKQLETWFGQPLFDRSGRSVKPMPVALEAAALGRELRLKLDALRARRGIAVSGRVRLGAIASVQADRLPHALLGLREHHPALRINVVLADSDVLQADLKAGRIDAAVLVRPQSGGSSRLVWEKLATQRFVMMVPASAQHASPHTVLQQYDLIRYDTALTGGRIAASYARRVFPGARSGMEVRSIDAIVAMVAAGLGVAIVPQPRTALLDAHGVCALGLGARSPARQIAVARRRSDAGNRNVDAVCAALAQAYGTPDRR